MSEYEIKTNEGEVFSSSSKITILDAALSANVILEHSCKSGQCGVCKTTIIEGEIIEIARLSGDSAIVGREFQIDPALTQSIRFLAKDAATGQIWG